MVIYFAGNAGPFDRFQIWLATGITRKLISYNDILTGGAVKELQEIERVNKDNDNLFRK